MDRARRLLVGAALVALLSAIAAPTAHADRAYSVRYAATEHGAIRLAANGLETCPTAAAGCVAARNGGTPPVDNGQFVMGFVDVDSDATTFDSSRADVSLPAGASVLWAGLYWSGDTSPGAVGAVAPNAAARNQVRFATPGAAYSTVTASVLDYDLTSTTRYQGFADVTTQVAAGGSGTYTVANVQAGTGANRYAGWSLVVAYRDASQPVRRLHVYDGFRPLQAGGVTSTELEIGDLLTPASGTVGARLAMVAWEGDRGMTGDMTTLGSRDLSDAVNPVSDFFNSTVSRDGASVTARDPAYLNTMGVDADDLAVDGALGNGVSSATLRLTTTAGDLYLPAAIALATDESPPIDRVAPSVAGTPRNGETLTADPGTWSGTPSVTYAYQWLRCAAGGTGCVEIAGATGATYTLGAADVGQTIRVRVTATNAAGSTPADSAAVAILAAAGSGGAGPGQAVLGEGDLAALPGSLVAAQRCQTVVTRTGAFRRRLSGIGPVLIRIRADAQVTTDAPVRVTVTPPRGRTVKTTVTLDGKRVRVRKLQALILPAALTRAGKHALVVRVAPPHGKSAAVHNTLSTAACRSRLTARVRAASTGRELVLRVDDRFALSRLAFTLPRAAGPRGGKKTARVGRMRYVVAGGKATILRLTVPAGKTSGTLVSVAGGPQVTFTSRGVLVRGLPTGTGIVELSLSETKKTTSRALKVTTRVTDSQGSSTLRARTRARTTKAGPASRGHVTASGTR
jgi:hypothetical protein